MLEEYYEELLAARRALQEWHRARRVDYFYSRPQPTFLEPQEEEEEL